MSVQMAEVAISRQMFADVLSLIARLRAPPPVRAQCTDSFRHAGQPAEHLPYVCLNLGGEIITAGRETERNPHGTHQAVNVLLRRQFQFQLDQDRTQTDSIKEQAAVTASPDHRRRYSAHG